MMAEEGHRRLLVSYGLLIGVYGAGLGGLVCWAASRGRLPRQVPPRDVVLFGLATHKLTRIIGKDRIARPVRAPFVEFEKAPGSAAIEEKSRGRGLRRALGDLVRCEYCLAPWVAGGLFTTYAVQPRAARFVAALFGTVAVSDLLNQAYSAEKRLTEHRSNQ
jgi:hypothetical protein